MINRHSTAHLQNLLQIWPLVERQLPEFHLWKWEFNSCLLKKPLKSWVEIGRQIFPVKGVDSRFAIRNDRQQCVEWSVGIAVFILWKQGKAAVINIQFIDRKMVFQSNPNRFYRHLVAGNLDKRVEIEQVMSLANSGLNLVGVELSTLSAKSS